MASDISCELQAWLSSRGLGDLAEKLAEAGFTEVEALLEAEESAIVSSATKLGFQGPACKRLLAELDALRRAPLPAALREKILELSPCQLMNLAAILEPLEPLNGTQVSFKDQHGSHMRPVQRLSARLDARQWQDSGTMSEPRKWRFQLTTGQVQPMLVPSFAHFESRVIVLMNFSKDEEVWVQREHWEPLISKALAEEQSVKFSLMVLTGTASMAYDPETKNLDSDALASAQEQGLSSYVGKIVFGLRGVVEMTAGDLRCKVTLGPPDIAKAALCRGTALSGMLDGVMQVARTTSRKFCRHWQPFQIISSDLGNLISITKRDGMAPLHLKEVNGGGEINHVERRVLTEDFVGDEVGAPDPQAKNEEDEVELLQLFSISLTGKFSEKGHAQDVSKDVEEGFNDMATGTEDDVGKQVRVVVQNLAAQNAFLHLALYSSELAEVERRLVYRKSKGVAGAERVAHAQAHEKPADLREMFGLKQGTGPGPSSCPDPVPPQSSRTAAKERALAPLKITKNKSMPHTDPHSPQTAHSKMQHKEDYHSNPASPKTDRPSTSGEKRARNLPPLSAAQDKRGSVKDAPSRAVSKESASMRKLAGDVFKMLDFAGNGLLSAPKLQWGFDAVAPIFELACPGFGPSAFESSEADGSHAHAYFAFLDENQKESVSQEAFEHHFVNAAELRPAQNQELEEALRLSISVLEKQRRCGAVLCTDGGNTKDISVQVGQELELLYSVLPEKVLKIQASLKGKAPLGQRAIIALIPEARVINSLEKAFADALCVVPVDPSSPSGSVSLAVPTSNALTRACVIRLYSGSTVAGHSQFFQVGDDLHVKVIGSISVVNMCTNINAALRANDSEDQSSTSAHIRRQETHALLEKIGSNELKPDLTVTIKRELLPRLVQVLLSPVTLSEKSLVPLAPPAPKVSNAGRGGILQAEEGPKIEWPIVDLSHSYLFVLEPVCSDAQGKTTGEAVVCYSYSLEEIERVELDDGVEYARITLLNVPPGQYQCYLKAKAAPGYSSWSHATYFCGVSEAQVSKLEGDLTTANAETDVGKLRKAISSAEDVWLVKEEMIEESRYRLVTMEQENMVRASMELNDTKKLSDALAAASKVEGVDEDLLKSGYNRLVELLSGNLREILNEEMASADALQSAIDVLIIVPDHESEDIIKEAANRIEAIKVEPALTAAIAGEDLINLIKHFKYAVPLAESCGKRWVGMMDEGRTRLGKLSEDMLNQAVSSNKIEKIELALGKADESQKLMTVARRGPDGASWHAKAYAIDSTVLWEARDALRALREAKMHEYEEQKRLEEEALEPEDDPQPENTGDHPAS